MTRYTRLMILLIALMIAIPAGLTMLAVSAQAKYNWETYGKDACIAQGRRDCF